jgi:hypothetical protein
MSATVASRDGPGVNKVSRMQTPSVARPDDVSPRTASLVKRPCRRVAYYVGMSTTPAQPRTGPTGLQKSMQFILQVIAGVLLADLVTKSVAITDTKWSAVNLVICIAAGAFLFRIFVDNLLYYEAADTKVTGPREYCTRLLLLGLDLASYVICYDIVFRIGRYVEASKPTVFRQDLIIRVLQDIALVEVLHCAWALITWAMLKTWHHDAERGSFVTWARLSAATAVVMFAFQQRRRQASRHSQHCSARVACCRWPPTCGLCATSTCGLSQRVRPNFTLQLTSGLAPARRPSRLGRPIPLRRHVSCSSVGAASAALRQLPCRSAAASMKPLAAECEIR